MWSLSRLVVAAAFAACWARIGEPQGPAAALRTRVVMLGTGTPNADPDRSGPSVAVVVDDHAYLVDAGPGVVRRAAAANRDLGIAALAPKALTHLFVTHLHSDHTLGVPDMIPTAASWRSHQPM